MRKIIYCGEINFTNYYCTLVYNYAFKVHFWRCKLHKKTNDEHKFTIK